MTDGDAARWKKTREAFEAALETPDSQRRAKVEEICDGDPDLLGEVLAMLESHSQADDYFDALGQAIDDSMPAVDDPERWLGQTIHGYRVVELIERGGMGFVFRGEPTAGGPAVAIKVLAGGTTHEVAMERFRRERERLGGLSHPFIVEILDRGETQDGVPFYVMELIDGERIDVYADRHGLSVRQRTRLMIHVCEAVAHAHRHDVIHRDLKPSNILVRESGEPVLLDFGIAKLMNPVSMGRPTLTRSVRSFTPKYAGPELMKGKPVSAATDVYSLGVLLYLLLAGGTPPFVGDDPRKPPFEVLMDSKPPGEELAAKRSTTLEALQAELEGEIATVLQTAAAFRREKRYPNVAALIRALEECL